MLMGLRDRLTWVASEVDICLTLKKIWVSACEWLWYSNCNSYSVLNGDVL